MATLVLVAVVALWVATAMGGAWLQDRARRAGARGGGEKSPRVGGDSR